jgi:dipeptidyl aminopeptidase/acylaminoacyl peptidase
MTDQRTLTLDDVFALENIYDLAISPDGRYVAYVVSRGYTEGEHKTPASKVWLAAADKSSEPRQFTYGPHADTFPRWRPDGRTLAFLSDREKAGTQQIFLMPSDGGEARQLTSAKGGVQSFKWSADGKAIAYLAPDADSEEEEQRKKDKDDAEHVDHDYKFVRLWVVDLAGGEPRPITPPEYQVQSYAWLGPDAWAITTSRTPNADEFVNAWPVLRVAENTPAETLWQGRFAAHSLASTPDGRRLAWLHDGMDSGGWTGEVWALLPDQEPQCLLDDLDGSVNSLGCLPGGEALFLTATAHTRSLLARLSLNGGALEPLLEDYTLLEGSGDTPGVSFSDDGHYACLIEDGTHPLDVWVGELGQEPRRLTHHNAHLADVALGAAETIRWQAADGLEIEGVLIYPSGYEPGRRYPLALHYHGGPNWQWRESFMASWHNWGQFLAARGYVVLAPNPRGSTGRGNTFAAANRRGWGLGDLQDVLAGVDHLVELGLADPERLGVGGWSYGGFLTAWTIGHTDRFKAAVVGAGVTDLLSFQAADIPSWLPRAQMLADPWEDPEVYLRCSPISYAGQMVTPTLIPHGADDQRVRLGQGRELYNALRRRGVAVEMVVYPREAHAIMERHHQRDLLTRVADWFDRYLKQ